MDTQWMNSLRQGQRYTHTHILSGPRAGMVLPIPASSSVQPHDYIFDADGYDYEDDDDDDDDYLAAPAHRNSSKRPRIAATGEAILSLQEVTGRSRSGEECAICLQEFRADETLRAMPCSHAFHQHCISEWLHRNAVCPLCRRRLPEPRGGQAEEDCPLCRRLSLAE